MIQNNRSGNDERLRHWQKLASFFCCMEEISIWNILTYIKGKNKHKKRGVTYGNKKR